MLKFTLRAHKHIYIPFRAINALVPNEHGTDIYVRSRPDPWLVVETPTEVINAVEKKERCITTYL